MTDDQTYGLVLAFDDESPSYVHGFEAGSIWTEIRSGATDIETTTHTENRQTIRRMAVAEGWSCTITPSGTEGWDFTVLHKELPMVPPRNPMGLRIVE